MTRQLAYRRLWEHWPHTALYLVYSGLAVYFLAFNFQPLWFGVSVFMGLVSALTWSVHARKLDLSAKHVPSTIAAFVTALASLPPIYLALPLPLMASWFAGEIALERQPDTNYWRALGLWLGATALFVGLLIALAPDPPATGFHPHVGVCALA